MSPIWGMQSALGEQLSSIWGMKSPLRELLSLTWGLQSPMRDIICPVYEMDLRNGRRYVYFTTHMKTSITRQTCAKAVAILYRGEKPRTSILHDNYYLSIAMNRSLHTVVTYQCFQKLESFIKMNQALNCSFTFQLSSI